MYTDGLKKLQTIETFQYIVVHTTFFDNSLILIITNFYSAIPNIHYSVLQSIFLKLKEEK